jgi:hypothetical protein
MPLHDHPYSDVNIIYSVVQTGERTTDRGTNSAPNIKRLRNGEYRPGQLHPASSTTKTGHHEIAEILLKVALNSKNQNQSIKSIRCTFCEISIEFYSTSTEAPFGQLIKQKVSKELLLLTTIFIIMTLHFVV